MSSTRCGNRSPRHREIIPPDDIAPTAGSEASARLISALSTAVLIVALALTVIARMRLLDVPLERDEGEYAYVGQQLLRGVPPFISIYHVKLPGIYAAYAAILFLLHETHRAIHIGLLGVNVVTSLVVFLR